MTRKEGFIDLDNYFKSIGFSSLDISDLDYEKKIKVEYWLGNDRLAFWFSDNGNDYLFKTVSNPIQVYLELVCEQIAKQLDLPCAHYEMATFQNNMGVISKCFKKKNATYYSGSTLLSEYYHLQDDGKQVLPYNNLTDILEMFSHQLAPHSQILFEKLKHQLISIFMYDMITNQADRKPNNWGIEMVDQDINLQMLFDNQESFGFSSLNNSYSLLVHRENYYFHNTKEKIITDFFKFVPKHYLDIFIDWYSKIDLDKAFLNLFNEHGYMIPIDIQEMIKESFHINKEMVYTILESENLLQKHTK